MSSKIPNQLKKFDKKQAKMGMDVEKEHQDVTHGDTQMTAKIAASHLKEDPKYYSKLAKMEESVSNIDQQYLNVVKRGDMETAQKMVDDAAKSAGYTIGPVYHGTVSSFNIFDNKKTGRNDNGLWGRGHYFANSFDRANSYASRQGEGARIIAAFVMLKNPLILKTGKDLITRLPDGTNTRDLIGPNLDGSKIKNIANKGGHDGVIQFRPNGEIGDLVVYFPNQIKSADPVTYDNEGNIIPLSKRFNVKSDDIRESISINFPKFESVYNQIMTEIKCWSGYKKQGTKMKNGKRVNNCVSINKNK